MTPDEAKEWLASMPEEQVVSIVSEWHTVKQLAMKAGVATGEKNWVLRFEAKLADLMDSSGERKILVREIEAALLTMQSRLSGRPCRNCMGDGVVNGRTCVCCCGTKVFNL